MSNETTKQPVKETKTPPKADQKVQKARLIHEKAQAKLPTKKVLSLSQTTGNSKAKVRLHFEEVQKAPSKLTQEIIEKPIRLFHEVSIPKITQEEDGEEENVGVVAVTKLQETTNRADTFLSNAHRKAKLQPFKRVKHTVRKLDHAIIRQKTKQAKLSKHALVRWQQKRLIQKQYYQQKRAEIVTKQTTEQIKKRTVATMKSTVKSKAFLLLGAVFLSILLAMNLFSACVPLFQSVIQAIFIATYPAEDADIMAVEWYYCEMEAELQNTLNNYPMEHDYDAYEYDLDEIWHDPHVLISLVSAHANGEWTEEDVHSFVTHLFKQQYTLTEEIISETRYRDEWVTHHRQETNPDTGELEWVAYEVLEPVAYRYQTCVVTLENFNLSHLPFYVLSREGVGRYAMYISVLGNREDLFLGYPHASTLREAGKHDVPESYLEDETFRTILEEAEKYIGYPYVWGGDSPETSFDCSGFVSYVYTITGVCNTGRLGATSLYGACESITELEAKPGDLVFFEGTISGEEGITHVGIYVGDQYMLHCGDPIGYADLTESYWQQHFFGYGRLINE